MRSDTYTVKVREVREEEVEVDAYTRRQAIDKAKNRFDHGDGQVTALSAVNQERQ